MAESEEELKSLLMKVEEESVVFSALSPLPEASGTSGASAGSASWTGLFSGG